MSKLDQIFSEISSESLDTVQGGFNAGFQLQNGTNCVGREDSVGYKTGAFLANKVTTPEHLQSDVGKFGVQTGAKIFQNVAPNMACGMAMTNNKIWTATGHSGTMPWAP
jgi:hypothetical protein